MAAIVVDPETASEDAWETSTEPEEQVHPGMDKFPGMEWECCYLTEEESNTVGTASFVMPHASRWCVMHESNKKRIMKQEDHVYVGSGRAPVMYFMQSIERMYMDHVLSRLCMHVASGSSVCTRYSGKCLEI